MGQSSKKLTKTQQGTQGKAITRPATEKVSGVSLVSRERLERTVSFLIERPLEKKYDLSRLSVADIRKFNSFIGRWAGKPWSEFETTRRPTDAQDKYNGLQIQHYEYADGSRVHGVICDGRLILLRIDPSHKFHN